MYYLYMWYFKTSTYIYVYMYTYVYIYIHIHLNMVMKPLYAISSMYFRRSFGEWEKLHMCETPIWALG